MRKLWCRIFGHLPRRPIEGQYGLVSYKNQGIIYTCSICKQHIIFDLYKGWKVWEDVKSGNR